VRLLRDGGTAGLLGFLYDRRVYHHRSSVIQIEKSDLPDSVMALLDRLLAFLHSLNSASPILGMRSA
jgi:hypothetical protein